MQTIHVVAVTSSEETRVALQGQLSTLDFVQFDAVYTDLADAAWQCQATMPDVIIIELTGREMDAGLFMQAINMNIDNPSVIVALHRDLDQNVMFDAVRQGAREFIQYPEEGVKVETALRKQLALINRSSNKLNKPTESTSSSGKVVSVFSSKGGSGSSTVAVNLASELKQLVDRPVVLLDMDLFFNNTAVILNTKPNYSLGDLSQSNASELDANIMKKIIVNHESGLDLVVGSKSVLDENEMISSFMLEQVISYLVANYAYVVVDLPSRILDPYHEYMVQRSDLVLLISSLDIPCLYRTRQYLDLAKQFFDESKIKLVLNRCTLRAAMGMTNKNLEDEFHYPIFSRITNDWDLNVGANSLGCVLSKVNPNAEMVKDIRNLASLVSGTKVEEANPQKASGGLLGKFFNGLNTNKRGDVRNALSKTELGI